MQFRDRFAHETLGAVGDGGESETRIRAALREAERDARSAERPTAARSEAPTVRPPAFLPMDAVPLLAVGLSELRTFSLDPSAGFLVSLIDGMTTVETLLDLCCIPSDEALARLNDLVRQRIVKLT